MKNFNLIKRLFMDSHDKQSPQRLVRYAAVLMMLLTLGVGQMWADNGDFYNMYLSYTFEGAAGAVDGSDNNTGVSVDAGTLTSGSLILTGVYLKCWDDWGANYKSSGGQLCYTNKGGSTQYVTGLTRSSKNGNNYEYQKSSVGLTIASYNQASGSFSFESWGQTWGDNWGDRYFPKSSGHYTINYKIAPPAVSGFTITPSGAGYVKGSGTSSDPYIMKHDEGNLVLTISGSKAHTDANSSAKYYTGSAWGNTATKTIYYASGSTTKQSITLKMKYNNSTASLDGAVSEITVYYQRENAYSVSKSVTPSAGGSVTLSSTTMGQHSGGTITATKNTGYNFTRWDVTSGTGTVGSATTASTTYKPSSNSTVRATFTAKNYTVKLSKNGGDTDGTITTTYNSTSTASFTGATYAGHSCDGYFTAKSGGSKIVNADGTLASGSVASYLSSGNWVGDTVTILYAQWTEDVTNYTVNYGVYSAHTSYGTLSCATTVGGSSITSGDEVASGTGVTFTASPISGYEVDAWYRNSGCTSLITEAGYANTFAPTITKDTTVYVKFKKKIYTITYSPSSAPTGCTYTTKPTTGTYGNTVTMKFTPSTGYTVSVSAKDASSNTVTVTPGANNTYTFTQPASAVTVTVSTSQIMSTLSTSISYDGANPSYSNPTKSVSSIGIATTATVTATAAGTGYTFAGWTLTNCTRTDGGAATANPITVRSNGDGAAATVVANYEEVLTQSTWVLKGGSAFGGSAWSTEHALTKKTGHSTESVVYHTFDIASTNTGDYNANFNFKLVKKGASDTWFGIATDSHASEWWYNRNAGEQTMSTGGGDHDNVQLRADVAGPYEIKIDYSNASSPKVTITFPTSYTLTYDIGTTKGNNGSITSSPSTASGSKVLSGNTVTLTGPAAKTGYTWKGWYTNAAGTEGKITDVSRAITVTMNADKTLYACYTENNYTVTVNAGSNGSVASTSVTGHKDTKVTLPTATPNLGYYFTGWTTTSGSVTYTNQGSASSAQVNGLTAAATVQANFAPIWYLKGDFNSWGEGNPIALASSTSGSVVLTTTSAKLSNSKFKIYNKQTDTYYQKANQSITRASNTASSGWTDGGTSNDMKFNSDVIGNYTFAVTFTTNVPSALTVTYPAAYTVTFGKGTGGNTISASTTSAGGSFSSGDYVASGANVTFEQTALSGYTFSGWYTTKDTGGSTVSGMGISDNVLENVTSNKTVWSRYTPNNYTVSLDVDEAHKGSTASATTSHTVTYNAVTPNVPNLPTAEEGYGLEGYYTGQNGAGTKLINGDGTFIASVDGYTDGDKKWVRVGGVTLYAYYKQAEIASITFDNDVVEPGATVTVTANLDPVPDGTTTVCWRFLHDNGNEYSPQPTFEPASGATVSFRAPETSTHYKVEATLRTGSSCGGGTLLDTETGRFQVAGSHTVTVNYKCGDDVIKAATSVTATPLDWTEEFRAPDIFGYTFARWDAADGVTIKNGDSDPVTTTTNATIQIMATYNGKLTAVYTQKSMIFFKNTLGWSDVYVNFYSDSYWNNPKGSGNQGVTNRNKHMTQLDDTDIWYYDYGAASITPSLYVSFTSASQDGSEFFWKSGGVNVVYPANYPDAINTDKSSETGFKAATPMFVPLATQDKVTLNSSSGGKADYYNAGYWTKYTPGTGYRLEIYNSAGNSLIKSAEFTSADDLMPMKATVDLEGGTTYKFQLKRSGDIYYGNSGTMTYANHGSPTPWDMTNGSFSMCGITTNASGDYTFNLSYSGNSSTPPHYRLRMAVDYPVADGDYRLIYKDAVHTNWHPSAIVSKGNNRKDTVSFFVRPGSSPEMKIQTASVNPSTGAVTWGSDVAIPTATLTGLTSTDVYNFNLSMDGSGNISLESVDTYTGNFYIRTDAANSKWDNYRSDPDHLMVYSEYSIEHGGYTHYHAHWVNKDDAGRKNVKFTIANDYSPCISDTLAREDASGTWANIASFMTAGGDLLRSANVRFMWDKRDNSISRAYVDGAQGDYSANFLYMLNVEVGADKIRKSDESALTDHKVTFKDNGNWMYEANIQAQPDAQIKLLSNWGTENTITQYFRGASDATETLIGGSGSNWYDIRLIYDFKTNRLIAGLIPSGTIDEQMAIHADVMFIREHQGDIAQLTFAEKDSKMGAITDIETAYGVLQFNKWTINNKSKAEGHAPLSPLLSRYERDLFYVSFPFRVSMEEVFGFGTYGTHWIIEYYDGANRAANGYWQESGPNWKFVTNRKNKFFEPGTGYIIALDLDELGESSSVWANTDRIELYFPSYGKMDNITSSTATYEIPAHLCTINRSNEPKPGGGTLGDAYDRRVKDSHWNVLGVPTYVNPDAPDFANTDWITVATETSIGPNFLYEWNKDDNSVSAVSASGYTYHAMHAYLVQYCGDVTWTSSVSVKPSSIVAREQTAPKNVEFKVELMQNEKAVDQTFVKLSDNENVTTGFEFNYDLSKEFNKNKANIYTMITSNIDGDLSITEAAGNVLPMSEQTTVVPVGVKIVANGDYTFSIPDGTEGTGVTLIDNETGIHTNLALMDYTVALEAGTYDGRFILEISPIAQTPTGVDTISDEGLEMKGARKVIIDEKMYILKDGKVYDARGARVQ